MFSSLWTARWAGIPRVFPHDALVENGRIEQVRHSRRIEAGAIVNSFRVQGGTVPERSGLLRLAQDGASTAPAQSAWRHCFCGQISWRERGREVEGPRRPGGTRPAVPLF